ncbi:uncharacterized protein LOC134726303 [Mytilus trossulus]|uniref:uncharacterized protein LOC134726303 n=1 Tax=Mytilus trossulus TaxID=6551 RepID=UPI00300516A2
MTLIEERPECQRNIRQAHSNYVKDIISPEAKQNPKKFWSFVKSGKQEASGVAPLRNTDGLIHSDPNIKANILNKQFKSVFTKEDTNTMPDKGPSPYPQMAPIITGTTGVAKFLKNLNPHKATGPDSISSRFLKELSSELAPALAHIFNFQLMWGKSQMTGEWHMWCPSLRKETRHINQTTAKASRSVGFLRRNLRSCPQEVKSQAYTTLMRPVFEYASAVWDPYQHQQIQQMENVQRQAARFAMGDFFSGNLVA